MTGVHRAKRYAVAQGMSVSKLVENCLQMLAPPVEMATLEAQVIDESAWMFFIRY